MARQLQRQARQKSVAYWLSYSVTLAHCVERVGRCDEGPGATFADSSPNVFLPLVHSVVSSQARSFWLNSALHHLLSVSRAMPITLYDLVTEKGRGVFFSPFCYPVRLALHAKGVDF